MEVSRKQLLVSVVVAAGITLITGIAMKSYFLKKDQAQMKKKLASPRTKDKRVKNYSSVEDIGSFQEDITLLGKVTPGPDGILDFSDFSRIYAVIKKYREPLFKQNSAHIVTQRRTALHKNEIGLYRSLVKEIRAIDEQTSTQVLEKVLNAIGLSKETFQVSYESAMEPENIQQFKGFQIQLAHKAGKRRLQRRSKQSLISREKAIEVCKYELHLKQESFQILNRTHDRDLAEEFTVQEAMKTDRIFFKFGLEPEDYDVAIIQHNLMADPQIQDLVQKQTNQFDDELKMRLTQALAAVSENESQSAADLQQEYSVLMSIYNGDNDVTLDEA